MMIVDLIDEVDFIEKLKGIGVPVTDDMSMPEVEAILNSWLQEFPEQKYFLMRLFEEMTKDEITLLPDVSAVMRSFN